ncbi:MAG: rod shape-determining protein MreD [Rikenellaceae bacterium]|jgi:hypothetical protein|nr:rod shape-determining protein MreD [Rikenellaceae bacterium]
MKRFFDYLPAFAAVALLQSLVFDNLDLGLYITPLVYPVFLAALPSRIKPWQMLFVGLLLGVAVDLLAGCPGLHTIASLFTAFCRQGILRLVVGYEVVREGVIPAPSSIGAGKTFRFLTILITIHCITFISFETLTTAYIYLTLLRIILSSAVSAIFAFLLLRLIDRRK